MALNGLIYAEVSAVKRLLTHSLAHSLTHSLAHSLTHSLTRSLAHSHTHTHTHSFIFHSYCPTDSVKALKSPVSHVFDFLQN